MTIFTCIPCLLLLYLSHMLSAEQVLLYNDNKVIGDSVKTYDNLVNISKFIDMETNHQNNSTNDLSIQIIDAEGDIYLDN